VVLLVAAFVLRAIWLTIPTGALIADENTYVNAARVIAGFPVPAEQPFAGAPAGIDPHLDQPVPGKLAIAASMRVLGDNPIGWRVPSLLAGMVALLALAAIVRRAGGSKWLSVLAVALLALDNLFLVHSRIATPDMAMIAGALVGAWLALGRRWILAGVAFAIASLFKPIALFAVIAAIAMWAVDVWRERRGRPEEERRPFMPTDLGPAIGLLAAYAFVGIGGLWLLDTIFLPGVRPFDHLLMLQAVGFAGPAGERAPDIASPVWLWLVNERQFDYIRVAADTIVDGEAVLSHSIIQFQVAFNPALIGAAIFGVVWTAWRAVRENDRLAQWATTWVAATAGLWLVIGLFANRATFLYHALIIVPGLAVAVAILLARSPLPRAVTWIYLALVLVGFVAYFPFRELPPPS
jgi:predicted membrane-bound dolichyl-phosphate-mannose-protein mannosyltransferase